MSIVVLAALLLTLALAGPAYAAETYGDKIIFGDNFTLAEGETVDGNLVVFGGNVTLEEGSEVTGDVVVFGGNVEIAGRVGADVTSFGGNVRLQSTAVVDGALNLVGGSSSREEGATVSGGESQGFNFNRWPRDLPEPARPFQPVFNFFGDVFNLLVRSVGLSLLALLVVAFWPDHTARVSAAATQTPGIAAGLGLLTATAVPVLIVLLAITLCLIPLSFLGLLLFVAGLILGWLALGTVVGARLSASLRWHNLSPSASAALGTGMLTLVTGIIGLIPCVGWVAPTLLGMIGLGAVVLTRFGTRPYLGGAPAMPPAVGDGGVPTAG